MSSLRNFQSASTEMPSLPNNTVEYRDQTGQSGEVVYLMWFL